MVNDYAKIFELAFDMLAILDFNGNFKDVNKAFTQGLGWALPDLSGKNFWGLILPNTEPGFPDYRQNLLKGHPAVFIDSQIVCKNGNFRALRWTAYVNFESQSIYLIIQEPKNEATEWELFKLAIEASPTALLIVAEEKIHYANRMVETIFRYSKSEMLGQPLEMLVPMHLRSVHTQYRQTYHLQPYTRQMGAGLELSGLRKDGSEFPIDVGLTPLQAPEGSVVICSVADITKRKAAEAVIANKLQQMKKDISKLDKLAKTDELTEIKNRRSMDQQLEIQLNVAQRDGQPLSFILLDIDNFKVYNDSFGHLAGDQVLKFIAEIMLRSVRHTEVVARYGGEEFAAILPATNAFEAKVTAERLRKTIEEFECPFQRITVSLGCATVSPPPGQPIGTEDLIKIIRMADIALYFSKNAGKNRMMHFDDIPASPEENLSTWEIRHGTPTDH